MSCENLELVNRGLKILTIGILFGSISEAASPSKTIKNRRGVAYADDTKFLTMLPCSFEVYGGILITSGS